MLTHTNVQPFHSVSHVSGDYENEVLKNCLGFVAGVGLTMLFYAWLCLQKDYPKLQAAIIRLLYRNVVLVDVWTRW